MVHACTTTKNPITVWEIQKLMTDYANYYPFYMQVSKPWAYPVSNPAAFRLAINATETIPLNMLNFYANISNNAKLAKQSKTMMALS